MAKNGPTLKKILAEFKRSIILDMRNHHLGHRETVRKYRLGNNISQGKILFKDVNAYIWKKE